MAFDGLCVCAIRNELEEKLLGGRISKISQPEDDEILLTIKNNGENYRLLMSSDASLPLIYLTKENKVSPLTAPGFCMLLRKHLQSARIIEIIQPDFERVIAFRLEHLNEMGDLCVKRLIIELMGKHSNIIFCDDNAKILDSIKHVPSSLSSVREVLPGRDYFIPKTTEKENPRSINEDGFCLLLSERNEPLSKAIYMTFTGFSKTVAEELCYEAGVDSAKTYADLSEDERKRLSGAFGNLMNTVRNASFSPVIVYENGAPLEFSAASLNSYAGYEAAHYDSISELLYDYYEEKNKITRIRQRSSDLRHIVQTALERNYKKIDLQTKQFEDTEKRDKYRVYGELLNTYGYSVKQGDKELKTVNYYDGNEITIPLDTTISVSENARKYFDRYGKLKRTREALTEQMEITRSEIEHLESVLVSLDIARKEEDLIEIRNELSSCGYIRKRTSKQKERVTSKPFHFVTDEGFDIYVGKNNIQNDELTFGKGSSGDMWFHAKKIPGSHVVLRKGNSEFTDKAFETAAGLAAFFSKGAKSEKVEVDYTLRKNVKKPGGAKPGFVVYYTNYSMVVAPSKNGAVEN